MAFHPNYAKNRRFYVNYTDRARRHARGRVSLGRAAGASRHGPRAAVREPAVLEPQRRPRPVRARREALRRHGGRRRRGRPAELRPDASSRLAKLLRTNPLAVDWEIAGFGLRNPWRFSFDRRTADLYIGDVGQSAREEIDFRPKGAPPANFGWARYEGSRTYDGEIELDPPSRRSSSRSTSTGMARVLGDGRLRLPRAGRPGGRRAVLLRRLLLGHRLEPAGRGRRSDQRSA